MLRWGVVEPMGSYGLALVRLARFGAPWRGESRFVGIPHGC
jgi:hypothetical protein